jgi:hypothetical protein
MTRHSDRSWLVVILLWPASLAAQEVSPWVGQQVVPKYGKPLKIGNQVIDDGKFRVYRVEQVNGEWL